MNGDAKRDREELLPDLMKMRLRLAVLDCPLSIC